MRFRCCLWMVILSTACNQKTSAPPVPKPTAPEVPSGTIREAKINIEYSPGLHPTLKSWLASIDEKGAVEVSHIVREGMREETMVQKTMLKPEEYSRLLKSFETNRFFGLAPSYPDKWDPRSEGTTISVALRVGDNTHKVLVQSSGMLKGGEEIERFKRIWAVLVEYLPTPNGKNQE